MRTVEFPVNCSIKLHVDFGHTTDAIVREDFTKEQILDYLNIATLYGKFHMITLNEEQYNVIGKIITDFGFECIKTTENIGNHKGKVKIYFLEK